MSAIVPPTSASVPNPLSNRAQPALRPSGAALLSARSSWLSVASRASALALGCGLLLLWTACTPESIDQTLNATSEDIQINSPNGDVAGAADERTSDDARLGDRPDGDGTPRNPRPAPIADGSSNTINLPESNDPRDSEASARREDDRGAGATDNAADAAETIRILTQEFSNRFLEFGRSSGNSDNDAFVTGTNELTLCASGRFFLREQFSFSSSVNFLPDPDDSIGTWAIVVLPNRGPAIELRIEQTTATSQPPVLAFAVTANETDLFLNGARLITFEDATSACQ